MPILVLAPTEAELAALIDGLAAEGHATSTPSSDRLPTRRCPSLDLVLARGGLGKVQFAIRMQYLLDQYRWPLAICAGAGGSLADEVRCGDVVVGTESVEHDLRKASRPLAPRLPGAGHILMRCRELVADGRDFAVHLGPIASGDEDVVSDARRFAVQQATSALAVAWEGAGGARACEFSGVPYVEVRGITDRANTGDPSEFLTNLSRALHNVARVLIHIAPGTAT